MNLPKAFISRTQDLLKDEYPAFERALYEESPISVRLNPSKAPGILNKSKQVPWSINGFYLDKRPNFTFDPLFHAGVYYVQEASSMFLGHVIQQYIKTPVRYLDLCAAPGGKTTDAISTLPEGSLIVSNEILKNRAHVLVENVIKWGNSHCIVTNNSAEDFSFFKNYFDVILTDDTCSGVGMFRKDADAINEWSTANVQKCVERQKKILHHIWEALRPGGLLIYSTCTYNVEEDEEIIEFLHQNYAAEILPVETLPDWYIKKAIKGNFPVYRFMPHITKGEGFFMAVVRKPETSEKRHENSFSYDKHNYRKKTEKDSKISILPEIKTWINHPETFYTWTSSDRIQAFPLHYKDDLWLLSSRLNILHSGIPLCYLRGKDYIPEHALATSLELNRNAFYCIEISHSTAITYLKRESIQISGNIPRGHILVTYQNIPLGWIKNIGNRTNNLYPQEWRIRSKHLPDKLINIPWIKKQ